MEIFIKLNFQGQFLPSKWLRVLKNTKVGDQLIPCPHKPNLGCIIKSSSSRPLHRCYMWFDAFKMRRLERFNSSAGNMCLCQSVRWAEPTPAQQARDFSDASFSALCPQPPTSASSSSLFTTTSVSLSILIIFFFFYGCDHWFLIHTPEGSHAPWSSVPSLSASVSLGSILPLCS